MININNFYNFTNRKNTKYDNKIYSKEYIFNLFCIIYNIFSSNGAFKILDIREGSANYYFEKGLSDSEFVSPQGTKLKSDNHLLKSIERKILEND